MNAPPPSPEVMRTQLRAIAAARRWQPFLAPKVLAMALSAGPALAVQSAGAAPPSALAATAAPAPAARPAAAALAKVEHGRLSWYGGKFAGRKTASGEHFNPDALTMAHKSLPFGTRVKVTNVKNNRSAVVRVNDRGPAQSDRIGDLSQAAAAKLGMTRSGVIDAKLEVVGAAPARKGLK